MALSLEPFGQKSYYLEVQYSDSNFINKRAQKSQKVFNSQKAINDELQQIIFTLYDNGYLTASVDSLVCDSSLCYARIYTGIKYHFSEVGIGTSHSITEILPNLKLQSLGGKIVSPSAIQSVFDDIITTCENNGYPFVSVGFENLNIVDDTIYADLKADLGKWIVFDSLIIKGSSKVKPVFMHNYLDVKKGKPYNEGKLQSISGKVADIPFLNEIKPAEIDFVEDKANIYLYLDKKRASQFDGFLGIAPDNVSTGKVLLTGELNLKLVSVINRGEEFSLNWRKLEPQSQDLRLNIMYPYLFSTPFGIDYSFKLFKKDTTYLNLINKIALRYHFGSGHYLATFLESFVSSLLNTNGFDDIIELPEFADIKTTSYGVDYARSILDYRYNPMKGINFLAGASMGRKTIKENPDINPEVYDNLNLVNNIYKANLLFEGYIPIYKNLIFVNGIRAAYLDNENLFTNELYRIGGLRTLRGFDEESIYASTFAIINIEARYLFERNSFVSLFWNGGWYESDIVSSYYSDKPWGFGAGISFESSAGIFSLYYALGKQSGNPIDLKQAKIHFGYTSLF